MKTAVPNGHKPLFHALKNPDTADRIPKQIPFLIVPGFSFIIADKKKLSDSKGNARSLSLDLYDQWETMEKDGKWRFTSPTHTVLAFAKALKELEAEGGIAKRAARYRAAL